MIERWVRFWDAKEHPRSIALVRILIGLTALYDFTEMWAHGLVLPLLAPQDVGGWADLMGRKSPPLVYQIFPPEAWVAHLHHGLMWTAALFVAIGFFTRSSALVLMLAWAQIQLQMPMADRAVDMFTRNVLMILMLSGAGRCWSVDAKLSTGRFGGDGSLVGSWARYLLIAQIVLMYFTAGIQKVGILWMPMGSFAALYVILQDPALARFDFGWLVKQPFYFFTQLATLITMAWQWAYPLVLLWYWYKNTPDRPGRLRAFANRWHLHLVWVAVGALFHLVLAATMELGIFPGAMLAVYPAFVDPDELKHFGGLLLRRVRG